MDMSDKNQLPERVALKLRAMFPEEQMSDAVRLLPKKRPDRSDLGYENLLSALVKISEGDLERLAYFSQRARTHPGDVILIGLQPPALGPVPHAMLRGGPIALPYVAPHPARNAGETMMDRRTYGQVCIVCGERVSDATRPGDNVVLSRVTRGLMIETSELAESAHIDCMRRGEELAAQQGLGWRRGDISDVPLFDE